MKKRLLFLSSAIAPLGHPDLGGVGDAIQTYINLLNTCGFSIEILAPKRSKANGAIVHEIEGDLAKKAQLENRGESNVQDSFLSRACHHMNQTQHQYDAILNFSYDWLPFYITPFMSTPLLHRVSMSSLSTEMDAVIRKTIDLAPQQVSFLTETQRNTFNLSSEQTAKSLLVSNAIDLDDYTFNSKVEKTAPLLWIGRISPEKGLEEAMKIAIAAKRPLRICGYCEDNIYYQVCLEQHKDCQVTYMGYLKQPEYSTVISSCVALLLTQQWEEAFGRVSLDALACGVPLIAYAKGYNKKLVQNEKNGFLITPGDTQVAVEAIEKLSAIDRYYCREFVKTNYGLERLRETLLNWLAHPFTRDKQQKYFLSPQL